MPHLRSGVRGDLHAHIDVVVPSRLDHDDIELLHKLKEKRIRDGAEVRSTQNASAGSGVFSRLRENFTGPWSSVTRTDRHGAVHRAVFFVRSPAAVRELAGVA